MSLKPIKSTVKKSDIKTGTHLLMISDMYVPKTATKEPMKFDGHIAIIVQFKDGKNNLHEQMYIIDGGIKQKYFDNMLRVAQVPTENGPPKKSDAVGKRLWGCIQEVHYTMGNEIVEDENGVEKIDYQLFKILPYVEGSKKPSIKGDPEENLGHAAGDFIVYKNIAGEFMKKMENEALEQMGKEAEDFVWGTSNNQIKPLNVVKTDKWVLSAEGYPVINQDNLIKQSEEPTFEETPANSSFRNIPEEPSFDDEPKPDNKPDEPKTDIYSQIPKF